MSCEVEYTDEFGEESQEDISLGMEKLEKRDLDPPTPLADTVRRSRHANMKGLRPPRLDLRVLFAFDPSFSGDTAHWRRQDGVLEGVL